jgi:hypothetical protein
MTDAFPHEELAGRAGVTVDYVDRLIELGILRSPAGDTSFSVGDVRKVRFVHALEDGGLPLEGMGTAVRNGDLSFDFFDGTAWERFGGSPKLTRTSITTRSRSHSCSRD